MTAILAFIGLLTASAKPEVHAPLPPLEVPASPEAHDDLADWEAEIPEAPEAFEVTEGMPRSFEKLHPEFRERMMRVLAQARAMGENPRILSGYRPLDRKRARRGRASWHAFGLALDINLAEYTSMRGALANMGRDAARWERLGRLVEAEGMIWGGRWRAEEVFHIEWHPGMPEGLGGAHLAKLLALAGPDGKQYHRTFPLFTGEHTLDDQKGKGKYWNGKKKKASRPKKKAGRVSKAPSGRGARRPKAPLR